MSSSYLTGCALQVCVHEKLPVHYSSTLLFPLRGPLTDLESDAFGKVFLIKFKCNRIVLWRGQIGKEIDHSEDKEYRRIRAEQNAEVALSILFKVVRLVEAR